MKGIMEFSGYSDEFVGKKSEFITKEKFVEEVKTSYDQHHAKTSDVYDGWVMFYPRGTQDHPESEPNIPFYMSCEKRPGAFECWYISRE